MHNFYTLNPNHQALSGDFSNSLSLDLNIPLHDAHFYQLLEEYSVNPGEKTQNSLGMYLNQMTYLLCIIPDATTPSAELTSQVTINKGDTLNFLICTNNEREVFLPIFTDDSEVKSWYNEPINTLSVPAAWLWNFILSQKGYAGVVINPNGIAWSINLEHIKSLLNDLV